MLTPALRLPGIHDPRQLRRASVKPEYERMNARADTAWHDFLDWLRTGNLDYLRAAYDGIEAGYALAAEPGLIVREWVTHAFARQLPGALRWAPSIYPLTKADIA